MTNPLARMQATLLRDDEPRAYEVLEGSSASPFVIACDHASNRIPRCLGNLGVSSSDLESHIAWDIGIAEVASRMAQLLGAHLVMCNYSRLVIDCNRPLHATDSIVLQSAGVAVPGNVGLTPFQIEQRRSEIFREYHGQLEAELDRRQRAGRPTVYVAMHSFTPELGSLPRPWHVGVLYQRDPRMAKRMLELLRAVPGLVVGDNEPYRVSDATDYSVVTYGERRGLPHVELEIRQDLIRTEADQLEWATRISRMLEEALVL